MSIHNAARITLGQGDYYRSWKHRLEPNYTVNSTLVAAPRIPTSQHLHKNPTLILEPPGNNPDIV